MLYRMYPDPVADNVMKLTFCFVTPRMIDSLVAYLTDSGYATREDIDQKRFEFSTAQYVTRITPKGIDLLEGNIDADPGIQTPAM